MCILHLHCMHKVERGYHSMPCLVLHFLFHRHYHCLQTICITIRIVPDCQRVLVYIHHIQHTHDLCDPPLHTYCRIRLDWIGTPILPGEVAICFRKQKIYTPQKVHLLICFFFHTVSSVSSDMSEWRDMQCVNLLPRPN